MQCYFQDTPEISYVYHESLPVKRVRNGFNITALQMYGLYRNAVYDSYLRNNPEDHEIQECEKKFTEAEGSRLSTADHYNDPRYHHAVEGAEMAIQGWHHQDVKSYIAYDNKKRVGFILFTETEIAEKRVVYICQLGVDVEYGKRRIGKHLMQCVLARYPAGIEEFFLLTGRFNAEAIKLYEHLNFDPLTEDQLKSLKLPDTYCGFTHKTTQAELSLIEGNRVIEASHAEPIYRL